jgi:predicted nuclease with TOPRIM domain
LADSRTNHERDRKRMTEPETEELMVPKHDYDEIVEQLADFKDTADRIIDENRQLKEALNKIQGGIHKASDVLIAVEGIIETTDQELITKLAFTLLKHHPKKLSIKYKGSEWKEVYHE